MREATKYPMILTRAAVLGCGVLLAACGGGGSDSGGGAISLSPTNAKVPVGGQVRFTLSAPTSTTWLVDGDEGGNGAVGTISSVGVYTAPFVLPSLSTAILPSPSTAVPPSPITVTVSASAAENAALVTVVSRFVADGAVSVGPPCSGSTCPVHLPNAVIAADLNHDDRSDLVTANSNSGTISVLLAGLSDTFSAPRMYTVGNPASGSPQALVAGDLDADTDVDLVVADAAPTDPAVRAVRTFLGNSGGTFPQDGGTPSLLPTNSDPLSMASGYFNDDTMLDVVVANFTTSTVAVMNGIGTGGFVAREPIILSGVARPLGVAAADFNLDGFDDFAVANSGDGTVSVFLSDPSHQFTLAETLSVSGNPSAVVAADLNKDGYPDLAVTSALTDRVTVIFNRGTSGTSGTPGATFYPPSPLYPTYTTGPQPIAMASGDWNKDGFADLVVANHNGKTITVFLGYGDGTLVNSETYPVGNAPQSVAVGDFNRDTWPDLAVANSGDDTVTILRNRGQ